MNPSKVLSIMVAGGGLGFFLQSTRMFHRLIGIEIFLLGLVNFIPSIGVAGDPDHHVLILSAVVGIAVTAICGWVLLVLDVRRGGE